MVPLQGNLKQLKFEKCAVVETPPVNFCKSTNSELV